ncbi:MAG: hypothetical protein AVDCRST_MAG43-445 [uncultured Thermomicrobiales bacterium]|uniref:Uncharacterized protein n=1 Tax=uncultured Thermomicrobiales bacterium TaxID=1645740 RepID=A0A6J4UA07_9BACT|nr:MAG: hypothetical protein AVDCRST_MAG43-445 [uncultured Thermomicrobiales bacterium]
MAREPRFADLACCHSERSEGSPGDGPHSLNGCAIAYEAGPR